MELGDKIEENYVSEGCDFEDNALGVSARSNFIRKVYSILGMQLTVTVGFVFLSIFNQAFAQFQEININVFWLAFFISIISLIVLACVPGMATKSPYNTILLCIFTLAESYLVSYICTIYTPESVLNAAVATLGATLGLTIYAMKTKTDFSDMYSKCYGNCINNLGFFWAFFCVSTFIIILNVFFIRSDSLSILIAIVFSGIYSLYLIIDTQLIMGGRKNQLTLDNYIFGAVLLYIDIIQLFLNLLRILGNRN